MVSTDNMSNRLRYSDSYLFLIDKAYGRIHGKLTTLLFIVQPIHLLRKVPVVWLLYVVAIPVEIQIKSLLF